MDIGPLTCLSSSLRSACALFWGSQLSPSGRQKNARRRDRLIAKLAVLYANRLQLLQWFWRSQLFAKRHLTTGRDMELSKYRNCPRKEFAAADFLLVYLG